MKSVLIVYFSRGGHTARIARRIAQTMVSEGNQAEIMDVIEADHEGIDWEKYDLIVLGCPVHYGRYHRKFTQFVEKYSLKLSAIPHSFFNVSGIARSKQASQPESNVYMQKFLTASHWKPTDVTCFAGNVDYPHYTWIEKRMIQLIMKLSGGPIDLKQSTDFTDWSAIKTYARHCLSLA